MDADRHNATVSRTMPRSAYAKNNKVLLTVATGLLPSLHSDSRSMKYVVPLAFCPFLLLTQFFSRGPNPAYGESPTRDTWSEFHGLGAYGVGSGGSIPNSWRQADYAWVRKLGSIDVGSPVVAAGKVFFLASDPKQKAITINSIELSSGTPLWSKSYPQQSHHLHRRNTYASSTPAANDTHVYVSWSDTKQTMLKCFDHDGHEVWSRDFGNWQSQHGFGTSPRLSGDFVLLFNSQQAEQLDPGETPGQSRMIAVDRKTGETRWETPLKTTRSCYGVPAITTINGSKQVIDANTGNGMFGLDASTGKMLWNLEVFGKRCCNTPLIVDDLAIASSGSGGGGNHLVAVKIPQSKSEPPREVFRIERNAPYVPTPAVKDGHLYWVDDRGVATCASAKTGEIVWTERIGGKFGASPIIVGDKLLIISLDGQATLLSTSKEFKEIGQFDLGGPVGATPAFAEGRLIIRVADELRCLGGEQS